MAEAIACTGLTKRYPDGTLALAGLSLHVESGTSLALIGGNGAGKSTLMHLVLGLLRWACSPPRRSPPRSPSGCWRRSAAGASCCWRWHTVSPC